jgi:hypothetical protein
VLHQIEREFAVKIAAALMYAKPAERSAIVSALKAEQAAKTAMTMRRITGEERAARQAAVGRVRAAQAKPAQPRPPSRPAQSSRKYKPLKDLSAAQS